MSDEVKVQNPTGTPTKNLVTLGQVKDALNKRDKKIGKLTEDLSNKITKFYASNQGEAHLADSDNGKIQDMMLYGKSSQDGTPTPENPVEIKSVVNPAIKICGKNLFDSKKFPIISNRAIDTNTGAMYESLSGNYCATEKYIPFPYSGKKISFNASMSLCAYDKDYKFISTVNKNNGQVPTGTMYVRFDIKTEEKDKAQIELSENATTYEPYKEQTIQLPITLNAIPVSSGGNVTINGQQYVADYVDVERGKIVRKINKLILTGEENWEMGFENWETYPYSFKVENLKKYVLGGDVMNAKYPWYQKKANRDLNSMNAPYDKCIAVSDARFSSVNEFTNELKKQNSNGTPLIAYYMTGTPQEENLSLEEIEFLKSLSTYYSVTNISIYSEQLDGLTVFNYPISMANGWNYVKQQLNDNRDYIYDMDLQSAEAYVNSEYAVALTELEV